MRSVILLPKIAYPGHHFKEEVNDDEIEKSILATNDLTLIVGDFHNNLSYG